MKKLSLAILAATAACTAGISLASSHREGPYIAGMPKVDGTDLYMFRSYEPGRDGFVTILANYQPFQDPQGGPNFYMFDPNALYEIHIDNVGDGVEHMTFQFRFTNASKSTALTVGGKPVKIPLIASGQITGVNSPSLNVRETYTVNVVRGTRRGGLSYLVAWKGYPPEEATWEPRAHVVSAREALAEFEAAQAIPADRLVGIELNPGPRGCGAASRRTTRG